MILPFVECIITLTLRRKYGERAARYVHIEVGHAAQNVYLQAEAMGLGTVMMGAFHDDRVKEILGLQKEAPLAIILVGRLNRKSKPMGDISGVASFSTSVS